MLQVWEDFFKELLNQMENNKLELPSSAEGELKLVDGEREIKKMDIGLTQT